MKRNGKKKFLAGLMSTALALTTVIGAGVSASAATTHNKSIKDNGDGTYAITLDVTGKSSSSSTTVTEGGKYDIVVLVDVSGSMMENDKLTDVKSAMSGLVDSILGNENIDAQMAVVDYGGGFKNGLMDDVYAGIGISGEKYDDAAVIQNWTSDAATMKTAISSQQAYVCSTNMQAGLYTAQNELFSKARNNSEKVVILLSDGKPNIYYDSNGYSALSGEGSDVDSQNAIQATNSFAKEMASEVSSFYAIATGAGDDMSFLNTLASNFTNNKVYTATTAVALSSAFKEIVSKIVTTNSDMTNVTIYDEMSEYVEFAGDTVKVTVDGKALDSEDYSVTKGEDTVSVDFSNALENGKVYAVTFNVKLTEETLKNKAGETVNTNKNAYVKYTEDGKDKTENYTSPTVQVPNKGLAITKILKLDGTDIVPTEDFTFVFEKITEGAPDIPDVTISVSDEIDHDSVSANTLTKSSVGNFLDGVTFPEDGVYQYKVSEKAGTTSNMVYSTESYTLQVTVKNGEKTIIVQKEGSDGKDDAIEFTNKYTDIGDPAITVEKKVTGVGADKDRDFEFTITFTEPEDNDGSVPVLTAGSVKTEDGTEISASEKTQALEFGKAYTFTLSDGDSIEYTAPVGTKYVIEETAVDNYSTKSVVRSGDVEKYTGDTTIEAEVIAGSDSYEVEYTNSYTGNPLTGLVHRNGAFLLLVLLALVVCGVYVWDRKRKASRG